MDESPARSLSRNRNFNIFWAGQALSAVGDAFGLIAMPLLVLEATGSVQQMGLVTGTFGLGQLIAGLFAGALVDRVDRRRLMIGCDLARMVLYSLIPLAWLLAGPQMWLIYAVSGVAALVGNTFAVASISAVPNLAEKDQITEANGRLQASYGVAFLVGPMLAGLISHQVGPAAAIAVNAASFAASAASLALIRLRQAAASRPVGEEPGGRVAELLAGVRFLWATPVLRWVGLLLAGFGFVAFAGLDLFIYHLKHDLGQDDNAVGLVFGISSVGAIAGALLAPRWKRRWGFAACWLTASLVQGITLVGVAFTSTVAAIGAITAVYMMAQTVRGINSMSLRQEITPDHLLGRVTAAFWTLITVPGPIGAALMTALAERQGAPPALALMGGASLFFATIGLFSPIRGHTRPASEPAITPAPPA